MSISSEVIENYGESILIGTTAAKGFLSPINKNESKVGIKLAPGIKPNTEYRLITDAISPEIGGTVTCAGLIYEILRVEQVRIFGSLSHTECSLRLKGRCETA